MLSSPRRPSSTMRIFSSAEWCRRVARRISRTVFSALSGMRLLACLIVAPQQGYDEPGILSYAIRPFCPTSADGLHPIDLRESAEIEPAIAGFAQSSNGGMIVTANAIAPAHSNLIIAAAA